MRKLSCLITAPILLCMSGMALIAAPPDPLEINPSSEQLVVDAGWGDQPGEFVRRTDYWGKGEVAGFGPFCLDDAGRIYIVDDVANAVRIFDPSGVFIRSVAMNKRSNIVSSLAVYNGRIYWHGETMPFRDENGVARNRFRVFSVPVEGGELTELQVSPELNLSFDSRGRQYSNNCKLIVTSDGLGLFAEVTSTSYPLLSGGGVVPVEEQDNRKAAGLKSDSAIIARIFGHGEIVRLGPDGQVEKVLIRNAGLLWGVAGKFFLADGLGTVHGKDRAYWELWNNDGKLLSRTRMPDRNWTRQIEIGGHARAVQLSSNGTWCEMYLDDLGVHISRFSH